jgi:Lipocalin-like domain
MDAIRRLWKSGLAVSASAMAENASIVGIWTLAAADKILPDGSRVPDYGPNPHGLVIFTANGYYSVQIYRAERLKFASGDKFKGTLDDGRGSPLPVRRPSSHSRSRFGAARVR